MGVNFGSNACNNVVAGYCAAYCTDIGDDNVILGHFAFACNCAGSHRNVFLGSGLFNDTTGNKNIIESVVIGYRAGKMTQAASQSVIIGHCAASCGDGIGYYNVGIGAYTFACMCTGLSNIGIGNLAGRYITGASNNVLIGHQAGDVLTTGGNNVVIGKGVDPSSATASTELHIGYLDDKWITGASDYSVCIPNGLQKSSGTFSIPHPMESMKETHELRHSFVEGPRADNLYRGNTVLSSGVACVNIDFESNMTDGTFNALNRCPVAYAQNVSGWSPLKTSVNNNFIIICSCDTNSTDNVNWLVIAERCDPEPMREGNILTDNTGRIQPEISLVSKREIQIKVGDKLRKAAEDLLAKEEA